MFKCPEAYRLKTGKLQSSEEDGNNGVFIIRRLKLKGQLTVIASDGFLWEHVSVSRPDRCPTYEELKLVKDLFWSITDTVVQYFPRESEYVNNHPYCLHLWRKVGHEGTEYEFPTPPSILVGIK
jgi:hypothetical protein